MTGSTSTAQGRIFISYRRDETDFPAGWLHDRLTAHFGRGQVFMDIDSIQPGANFVEVITDAVASCDVLLALIGTRWATIENEEGTRRIDDPGDFVRLELEAALQRDVLVIPILVGKAKMPSAAQLPDSLTELVHRHALELSPDRFEFDTGRLLDVLDRTLVKERSRREAEERARWEAEHQARLQLPQTEIDFGALTHGDVSPLRTIQLHNAGTAPLNSRATTDDPWIVLHQVGNTIQLRVDTAVVGRLDGRVRVTSDGGDATVAVRAVVRARHQGSATVRGDGGDAARVGAAPARATVRPRRRAAWPALLAVALAALLIGGYMGWRVTRPDVVVPGAAIPAQLQDAVADFGPDFTQTPPTAAYDIDTLERVNGPAYAGWLRRWLGQLGFRRGYARALHSRQGDILGVNVMEFGSAQAAREAQPRFGACFPRPEGAFEVPSIAGAVGQNCIDSGGRPVQTVIFTGGSLVYMVKLENMRERASTARIVELAMIQARKAS
jgi:hypothetical protein